MARPTPFHAGGWSAPPEFDLVIPELGTVSRLKFAQRIICATAAVLVVTTGLVTVLSLPARRHFGSDNVLWLVVTVFVLAAALILIERRVERATEAIDAEFTRAVASHLALPSGPPLRIANGSVGYVWLPTGRDGPQVWEVFLYIDEPCRMTVKKYTLDTERDATAA